MAILSKSKLIAFRQCPRRLWLEIHHPELRNDSASTQASFAVGYSVGEISRQIYDPNHQGLLIDVQASGFSQAFFQTQQALDGSCPIFEAGFSAAGALAFADVMIPSNDPDSRKWRMVEVKSSSSVKGYHRDDVAIQAYVARSAGVPLTAVALAHIDTTWTYPGNGDYRGLLVEVDLTEDAFSRSSEVQGWIEAAQSIAALENDPVRHTGPHCHEPFECGFLAHCRIGEPVPEHPVEWFPRVQAKPLKAFLSREDIIDMAQVPDELLNEEQRRIKQLTLENQVYFDTAGSASALSATPLPGMFLDFETINFVVPVWSGTRPYQHIPFQFSLHTLDNKGHLSHQEFLDLSGDDPTERFSQALIKACAQTGPIFVYNKGFEGGRITDLAERYPQHQEALLALLPRLVDLWPIAKAHYYHPSQQGSWSIKKVLPAMVPELSYDDLEGVQDGMAAMKAYMEAMAPETSTARKKEIECQLLAYCRLDTFAMIRIWSVLAGRDDLRHLPDNA